MQNAQMCDFLKRAIEQAREAGLPAYFLADRGPGVVRVLPDGRKDLIVMLDGQAHLQPAECGC